MHSNDYLYLPLDTVFPKSCHSDNDNMHIPLYGSIHRASVVQCNHHSHLIIVVSDEFEWLIALKDVYTATSCWKLTRALPRKTCMQ